MADDKKPAPKPPAPTIENFGYTLLGFLLLALIISRVLETLSTAEVNTEVRGSFISPVVDFLTGSFLVFIKFLSFGITVACFFGIAWVTVQANKIAKAQKVIVTPETVPGAGLQPVEEFKNKRWEKVLTHMNSDNQNDWKFAILEADIILAELLDTMSYRGETIADKLKKVEPSDFQTIEAAWEAHKVRNTIAHEGTNYVITEREAKRVISLYRVVFEEFHYI